MTHIGTPAPHIGRLLLPLCLIAAWTLLPSLATADIYKWTDAQGKTNYTQMPPPPGYTSELIKEAAPHPAAPVKTAEGAGDMQQAEPDEEQEDPEQAVARAKREKENAEIRRLNCDAATRNLEALQDESQRNFITADGKYLRPTDEERKKLIENARKQTEKHCLE